MPMLFLLLGCGGFTLNRNRGQVSPLSGVKHRQRSGTCLTLRDEKGNLRRLSHHLLYTELHYRKVGIKLVY